MSTIARSYRILSGAAELSSAAAAFFFFFECLDWASVATLENNTAIPSMASRVRRNRHLSGKFGFQGPGRAFTRPEVKQVVLTKPRTDSLCGYGSPGV